MSKPPSSPFQSKNGEEKDASIELRDFVYDVESSAKKILARQNKRRMEEVERAKQMKRREMFNGSASSPANQYPNHVSPGKKQVGSRNSPHASAATSSMSKSMQQTVVLQIPAGMKSTLGATSKYGYTPSPISKHMKIDRPSLSVTVGVDTITNPSPIKRKKLSFTHTESPVGTPTTPIGGRNAGRKLASPSPVKTIHSKLRKSPFFSQKMSKDDKAKVQTHREKSYQKAMSATLGTEVEEEQEDFHISRGIGSIMSSKHNKKKGKNQAKLAKVLAEKRSGVQKASRMEVQGPISWASEDLRVKYRCEERRMETYNAYLMAVEEAKVLEREDGMIVSVAEQQPHPIYELYDHLLHHETTRASHRARARNRMRRFVLDVHTVWITNLPHLDEHADLGVTPCAPPPTANTPGIAGRRDVEAIAGVSSQIQSIAPARAFVDAQTKEVGMEADGNARRKEFLENVSKGISSDVKNPPALHKPISEPSEFWTLVNGELLDVPDYDANNENKIMVESRLSVNRLRRQAQHGETPAPALWSATVCNVATSEEKTHTISALDLDFWLQSTNGDDVWRKILPMLAFTKWSPEPPLDDEADTPGEEKKDETATTPTAGTSKKRRKTKNKASAASSSSSSHKAATSKTAYASLLKLTIPEGVKFSPTPQHNESDTTIRIGGLTQEDIYEDAPPPPLPGSNDFYSAVSTGYELINCLKIVDGELTTVSNPPAPSSSDLLSKQKPESWANDVYNSQPPLSLRVSGRIGFHQFCPGVVAVGRKGLWWQTNRREGHFIPNEDKLVAPEKTRPIASYLRDSNLSSSASVVVNCVLALESPLLSPLQMCWEPQGANPPPAPHLEVECIIPYFMNASNVLTTHPVESPLDTRTAPSVLVLTRGEVPTDFAAKAPHGKREKHRRRGRMFTKHSFRTKVLQSLLFPDDVIPPYVFGVTQKGAQLNTTGVNGRNMWHSEQRCVEQLCRVRGPIDYLYVAKNEWADVTGGIHNEPNIYTMHMYGYKMNELSRNGERDFDKRYKEVLDAREAKMKQEALAAKIEAGKLLMEKKRAEMELMVRQEGLKQYENAAKGGGKIGEGLSTRSWLKRVKRSVVISFQEVGSQGWEQRLDPKYNQMFYHNTDPYITPQLGNQWDPPEDWNEDLDEALGGGMDGLNSRAVSRAGESRGGVGSSGTSRGGTGGGGYVRIGTRGSDANNLKSLLDDDLESTGSEVEKMVDALATNEEFIRMIAHKLGVPEHQIRGLNREIPLNPREDETSRSEGFRDGYGFEGYEKKPGMVTMAGETELAEDDDGWSDSDDEVGGDEEPMDEFFPQDHVDVRKNFVKDRADQEAFDTRFHKKEGEWKSIEDGAKKKMNVPKLALEGKINAVAPLESLEAHVGVRGYGWRRLGKEKVGKSFFTMKEHKIEKCTGDMYNKPSKASMVGMVDPKDAVDHSVDDALFEKTGYESMFIRNCLDDIDRCNKMTEIRVAREKMLMDDSVSSLQEIINVQPSEFTTIDNMIMKDNEDKTDDMVASDNAHKAILAVKNANFDDLETVLDEGVQIDTQDEYGNTLLILACQQGNKRMAKFLLRRGAQINAQNNLGNTVLHYLHEYKNDSLFEYMKQKGADDSLINADGTTCYEGLKKDNVDQI
ncbi:hypothetical protein TrRE_jg2750 [Triparma retinervis]|uniref:Uncharacterized protein n=1 Tax=Triparma retinervis TaxID=2557542 RepID=A0A9W7CN07_9STRA|nr:hypothetical protein TrRE_jg2750 [Triparma retinervis]